MSAATAFGTLDYVDVRQAWSSEPQGFTPWLSENIGRLGQALKLNLEHTGSEVRVTRFAADILAQNLTDGSNVLIENQLEVSDHRHLGQILTYLAGLDARTVIWVAPQFHEAHLSALRWLNTHTPIDFFAVRLRIARIGDSPFAPVFEVEEGPNSWEKGLQAVAQAAERGPVGERRLAFWTVYCAAVPAEAARGQPNGALYRWAELPGLGLVLSRYVADGYVGICVRGPRGTAAAPIAERLGSYADALAARLGVPLDPGSDYLFNKTTAGAYADPAERDRLVGWLSAETDRYAAALTEILGDKT